VPDDKLPNECLRILYAYNDADLIFFLTATIP
jgi:hypothetical protein